MRFDTALKKLDGQSVGGQLIVQHEGANVIVGKYHDEQLIVAEDPVAQALVAGLTADPLDHDNDGAKGGSESGKRKPRKPKETAPAPTPADDAADDADDDAGEATEHQLDIEDAIETEDSLGGDDQGDEA